MPSRHRSRQRALQILYLVDLRKQSPREAVRSFYETLFTSEGEAETALAEGPERDSFMESLVEGASRSTRSIDEKISAHSEHWRLERMPAVDRNILRLAIYEMMEHRTPPAVVIDEAIELARRFSGEESVPFINGVLDAVRRELSAASGQASGQ